MSGGAIRRLVLGSAMLLGGCQFPSVALDADGLPVEPFADERVGPAIMVAEGESPGGSYRAWLYRTQDGMTCFEVATLGGNSSVCGDGPDGTVGLSVSERNEDVWFVSGGTRQPAVAANVAYDDGTSFRVEIVRPPVALANGVGYLVHGSTSARPVSVELLDEAGTVLDTSSLDP